MRIGIAALGSRPGGWGGLNIYTRELVGALADYAPDHSFYVLINESVADAWDFRSWPPNVRFVTLRSYDSTFSLAVRGWRYLRRRLGIPVTSQQNAPYITWQLRSLKLDLIHFPETLLSLAVEHIPSVLTFFDLQQEYYPEFFTPDELASRAKSYKPSVDKATRVVVPTRYTQQTLIEKYQTPIGKMTHVPAGISRSFRRPAAQDIARARARYGLPDEFIFYPANPWQHKNHARLMAALRIYRDRFGECPHLVLSGRLPHERRDSLSLAIAAGVENRVTDLTFVATEDLPALYSAATLMVFPSLFEGFGIPLVEAMACGCPIVAADATTIPEVTNGAALLFDPFDPEAIAAAIHAVLTRSERRQQLVERGYQQLGRFDWETIVAKLIDVYRQVACG